MTISSYMRTIAAGGVLLSGLAFGAFAETFDIPGGDLKAALDLYAKQTNVELLYLGGRDQRRADQGRTWHIVGGRSVSAHSCRYGVHHASRSRRHRYYAR